MGIRWTLLFVVASFGWTTDCGIGNFGLFVLLISGIILWWPKNKGAAKQRFSVKWNAQWRRKNYDFHNVLGFYASWVVVVLVITGLVWGFQWFSKGVYAGIGGKNL
jgi:uncharacterized iron-regulated membrane protein